MQRFLPFIFPAIALVVVAFLAFRWYGDRTTRTGDIGQFGEGVEIEELSDAERQKVMRGALDLKTVTLQGTGETTGQVRYEIVDGKVRFSVSADLPEIDRGLYQVWLKDVDSAATKKAFTLDMGKGGYTGSAAISEDTLPFEVLVTRELADDNTPEDVLLRGIIAK